MKILATNKSLITTQMKIYQVISNYLDHKSKVMKILNGQVEKNYQIKTMLEVNKVIIHNKVF